MKNREIQSFNSKNTRLVSRGLLVPNVAQAVFYALIGLLVLAALNGQEIWHYFNHNILSIQSGAGITINENSGFLAQAVNSVSRSRAPQIIFWVFVGCGAYTLVWLTGNIFTNIRNDFVADEYIHPPGYSHAKYWKSVLARKIFFSLTLLLLLIYVYTLVRLFPLLAAACQRAVENFSPTSSLLKLAGALLAATIIIHLFVFMVRLLMNSWKFIFRDL